MTGDVERTVDDQTTSTPSGSGRFRQPFVWAVAGVALLLGAGLATIGNSATISGLKGELAASEAKVVVLTQERDSLAAQLADSRSEAAVTEPAPAEPAAAQAPATVSQPDAFKSYFAESRGDLLAILEDDDNIETVDKLVYDSKKKMVILDVTSAWAAQENQEDGAWAITRAMAELWTPDDGAWWQDSFVPAFRLVNSGKAYQCSGQFMSNLADSSASRSDWNKETR